MRDDEYSDFGFINSVLVFLVSLGLTLVLLWIVSRIIGQPWFENLPDWLTSGLGKILVGLFSGGSLAAIVVKKLASRHSLNFFYRICGTTLGLFIVILLLVFVLRPRQSSAQSPSPVPNPSVGKTQPPPPAPKKELHKTDENGQDYLERWNARGNCREATQDDRHQCIFTSTRRHIGESKDPFDHWKLMLKTPGPPYEVLCEPGGWQLKENDTPGPGPGKIEGNWATCSGWINGSEDPIQMTVKYQMLW
jgi:hypothetical protein